MKKTVKTFLITGVARFIGYSFAKKLLHILETGENEIFVEKDIIDQAKGSIEKLLKFTCNNKRTSLANDA